MKSKFYFIGLVFFLIPIICKSQGFSCDSATLICTGQPVNIDAGSLVDSSEIGPNYGCLYGPQPNFSWFYMKILNPGNLALEITCTPSYNLNFVCWGPFTSHTTPCVAQLTAGTYTPTHGSPGPSVWYPTLNMIDCSSSASLGEFCYIPNGITGQFYILMISRTDSNACTVTLTQNNGFGTLDCTPVAIDEENIGEINKIVSLKNIPNPFNDKTSFTFSVPYNTNAKLDIFDVKGRHIKRIFDNEVYKDKEYMIEFSSENCANGFYVYRLTTNENIYFGKAILVKN